MDSQFITVYDTPWLHSPDEVLAAASSQRDIQLPVGEYVIASRDFFARRSLADLAQEQGVRPIKDISIFAGGFPEDENLEELLDELDRLRDS